MGVWGLLGLLTLLVITGQVRAARLFVVAPNMFNVNEDETVSVLVTGRNTRSRVTLTVRTPGTNAVHYHPVSSDVQPDKQKIMKVKVDGSKLGLPDVHGRHYVKLRAQCEAIGFDKETSILVSQRTGTVFLQTDKPLYSPKQNVLIRVFALDEERKATNMSVRVELKNPQDVITFRKQASTQKGYFMTKHELSNRPLEGNWTVVAYFGANFSQSREKKIEVKKYVLPHFQVRVLDLPDYIDNKTQSLEGAVEARYSFAAPVVGYARVICRVVRDNEAIYLAEKKTRLIHGKGAFTLTRRELEDQDTIVNMAAEEGGLQIEATVTEQSTGVRERVVAARCPFTDSPYRVSFEGTAVSFMPGLEFRVQVRVYHLNGRPAKEVSLTVTGEDNQGQPLQEKQDHIDLMPKTDTRGRHHHYFDVSRAASPITVTVKVEGYRMENWLVIPKMSMTDPEYMLIRPKDTDPLNPGVSTYSEARLTEYKNIKKVYYMLVSGGRILEVAGKENVASHHMTLSHDVTYNMTPSVRLVAWYFPDSSHLVSAATTIPVETACRTEAKVLIDGVDGRPNILKPHDQLSLTFRGAIGANVSLMAVDKSVYFLNSHTQLTRERFFDEFMTRDLGCASGGGMNATDVFHLAGLTILSNSFETPRREQEGCRSEVRSRRKRSARIEETAAGPADSVCCEAGHGFATNLSTIPSNLHRMRKSCYQGSNQPGLSSRKCKNTFVNCCVKKLIERFEKSMEHSRTGPDFGIIEEINFIEDKSEGRLREDFHDSWMLLSDIQIPSSGSVTDEYTLPSTVTTWVIQAVTMSDTEGMCVAPPVEQVVRKDLFVKLHLPHTAVQGEQIELAATVYNLDPDDVRVKVGLLGTEESCSNAQAGSWSIKTHTVQAFNSWTARWPFVPMEIGNIPITVRLKSSKSSDTIRKALNVVPSGDLVVAPILQITQDPMGRLSAQRQWSESAGTHTYTALKVTTKRQQINTITLKLPEDALADTADIKLSLIGDVMTPAVEGLAHGVEKHLIKAQGCPEQTMARLGPTVFAAEYIRRTNHNLSPAQEQNVRNIVVEGVKHMLQYRRPDGSFGSIWITAFALKTFVQARTFTQQVDQNMIRSGFDWLLRMNTDRGLFDRFGIYNHRHMVGVPAQLSGTAFVYIAMMEANVYQRHHVDLDRAMNYLAGSALTQNDHFTLAIVSYALALRGHSQAAAVNQRLLSKAKVLPGTVPPQKYWPQGEPQALGSELETETAGYGLLAQLTIGNVTESNAIVEWLIRQRYGGPLYKTTQSTVVSLQALSMYSSLAPRYNLHMECTASLTTNNNILKKFDIINNNNRLVQQTFKMTDVLGEAITLNCTGDGVLHAAIETTYYSSKSNDDTCAFTIKAIAEPKNATLIKTMSITVCTRLKDGSNKLSMPMVDVGIGSGSIPVDNTLQMIQDITNEVDFYEVNDRSVVFYLSEIPSTRDLCLNFDVKQEVEVKNVRRVPVKVYAYYEPDKLHCRRFYNPLGAGDSMLQVRCDKRKKYCKCLENACPPCYGYDTDVTHPMDKKALKELACRPGSSFDHVLKATLVRVEDFGGDIKLHMRIVNVAKEGIEHRDQLQDQERIFTGPAKCPRCPYDEGENYIIMGEDGKVVKNGIREYIIGPKSYLLRLYARREYRQAGLTSRQRRINRNHKVFLEDMEANGCST